LATDFIGSIRTNSYTGRVLIYCAHKKRPGFIENPGLTRQDVLLVIELSDHSSSEIGGLIL
jgi:hypothetical protein